MGERENEQRIEIRDDSKDREMDKLDREMLSPGNIGEKKQ